MSVITLICCSIDWRILGWAGREVSINEIIAPTQMRRHFQSVSECVIQAHSLAARIIADVGSCDQ